MGIGPPEGGPSASSWKGEMTLMVVFESGQHLVMNPVADQRTWNRTEWVCNRNSFEATLVKTTFTFAYVSSPLAVYPMINSTCVKTRKKRNDLKNVMFRQ